MFIFLMMFACGEKTTLQCAEDVLQECDAEGTCTDVQDCAADDMICHDMGDDSHCMPAESDDSAMEMDSGTDM